MKIIRIGGKKKGCFAVIRLEKDKPGMLDGLIIAVLTRRNEDQKR